MSPLSGSDRQPGWPRGRVDVVTERLGDELIVFDGQVGRAHSLNATAAAVWSACDGSRSVELIASETGLDPVAVQLALANLDDAKLITDYAPSGERVSRRAALARIAVAGVGLGVALPVIRSVVAPSAAAAASGASCNGPGLCGNSSYCSFNSHCRPGHSGSHSPGHACTGDSDCSYNASCVGGTCKSFSP